MTVYADVLLVINLFVNYALLLCASIILKSSASRLRLLSGALVGSAYGLIIFLPDIPNAVEFLLRIAVTCVITLCAFGFKNIRRFLRCFFTFLAVSFVFGGIMLVLWVTVAPRGMVYNNGAVYFDIDLAVLAVSTVVCFAIVSVVSHFTARRAPISCVYKIKVTVGQRSTRGTALMDTGNSLRESFSTYPVIIGERATLGDILPSAVAEYLDGGVPDDGIRLITHRTVSGVGVMPAFKPDSVEISSLKGTVKTDRVYIAVSDMSIASGEYDFILNPAILEENNYVNHYENKKMDSRVTK